MSGYTWIAEIEIRTELSRLTRSKPVNSHQLTLKVRLLLQPRLANTAVDLFEK
jgi:hypothetical protein